MDNVMFNIGDYLSKRRAKPHLVFDLLKNVKLDIRKNIKDGFELVGCKEMAKLIAENI